MTDPAISSLATAQAAIQQALTTLKAYGEGAHLSIKQGHAFEDVSEKTTQAAAYVSELSTQLKAAKTFGDIPVDVVGDLVSKALGSLSTAADYASEFDRKYSLSQQLYVSIENAVGQAQSSLNDLKARASAVQTAVADTATNATAVVHDAASKVTDTVSQAATSASSTVSGVAARVSAVASNVTAQEPVQKAHAALQELVARLHAVLPSSNPATPDEQSQHDALKAARELVASATEHVGVSLEHLKQAPLTEMPVVAALEALSLARSALAVVGSAVTGAYTSSGVATAVTTARDRAKEAVTEATTQLTTVRERLTVGAVQLATNVANAGVDFALRQAVSIDQTYNITDRVRTLDDAYGVSSKVAAATATAQSVAADLDRSYNVTQRALDAIDRAKQLDSSITGGRATAITTSAIAVGTTLANSAVEYAKNVVQRFEEAKAAPAAAEQVHAEASQVTPPAVTA